MVLYIIEIIFAYFILCLASKKRMRLDEMAGENKMSFITMEPISMHDKSCNNYEHKQFQDDLLMKLHEYLFYDFFST